MMSAAFSRQVSIRRVFMTVISEDTGMEHGEVERHEENGSYERGGQFSVHGSGSYT